MAGMKILLFAFGQSILNKENFLLLKRTQLETPSVSSSNDSGFDTVF